MSYRARLCEQCRQPFRPHHVNARFCSRECLSEHRVGAARYTRPRYAYAGRLSDELQREVAAARDEAPATPLWRPGGVL